jgi:Tol biopolymer transport system component
MTELNHFCDFRRRVAPPSRDARQRASARLASAIAGEQPPGTGRLRLARFRAHTDSRRRLLVLAAAVLIVAIGTASAFGTVRGLFFGARRSVSSTAPTWSPDGQRIAFVSTTCSIREHQYCEGPSEVDVVSLDGSGRRNLSDEWAQRGVRIPSVDPIWSPDWRKIVFVSNPCAEVSRACARTRQIYVMNADGNALRRVARGGKARTVASGEKECPCAPFPTWSPDGRRIAFGSERKGMVDIYVMNADGNGQRRLTRGRQLESSLAWSPDGRMIAFVEAPFSRGAPRRQEIFVVNAEGGDRRMLARGSGPVWSPDGKKIAFRSGREGSGEIYVVNADGSGLRRLTRNPASDGGPMWSPDGRKILFQRFRGGNSDIYVMNADGGGQRNLTPEVRPARIARDSSPTWSPDGRRIAFVSERDNTREIYVMNADGSRKRNLTQLKQAP